MQELITNLFPMNACLLGEGYDNRLEYLKHLLKLDLIYFNSGEKFDTWTIPENWIVRDAWVKDSEGNKIIDYKKDPLSLVIGSIPFHGKVSLEELRNHWCFSDDMPDAVPYNFMFYEKGWGFCVAKNTVKEKIIYDDQGDLICEDGLCIPKSEIDPSVGKVRIQGVTDWKPEFKDKLAEGEYEVFIDTEFQPGIMKMGVHVIPGKSDREILLFAHLDHPFQANDNLSGVACLVDLAAKLKAKCKKHGHADKSVGWYGSKFECSECLKEGSPQDVEYFDHTIKIVFCPETIGSIAYAKSQDLSKVDFVIAVDVCGNDNSLLLQKSFDAEDRINRVAHVAIQGLRENYRKGGFRSLLGSDEYAFNNPDLNIPGILLSRFPYKEYHTSADTPEKINYEMIEKTGKAIEEIIKVWEADFIPKREVSSPLMRSKYGVQTPSKEFNLSWDYFWYSIDGKRSLAELCCEYGLDFWHTYDFIINMENDGTISRVGTGKKSVKPTTKKKS